MSRFETPDMALRRAQILAQRETQKQKQQSSIAAAVRRMRKQMGVRPALSLMGQGVVTERHAGGLSPPERERFTMLTPAEQLREARGRGRLSQTADMGAPTGEPVFPGVVGKIPGLRTPAEAASTIGTAGMGSLPMAAKSGALALGLGGAFGGGELADVAGAPRWVGELGGGLAGGLVGGVAGPMYARRAGPNLSAALEEAGGWRGMVAGELGGTKGKAARLQSQLDTLEDRISRLSDLGEDTTILERQAASLEDELADLAPSISPTAIADDTPASLRSLPQMMWSAEEKQKYLLINRQKSAGRPFSGEAGGTRIPRGAPKVEEGPVGAMPTAFDEARETLLTGMKQQRKNITVTKEVRRQEFGERFAASEEAYQQALREGKTRGQAFAIKRGMQAGEYSPVEGVPTPLNPEQEEAIAHRIDTFDFGRGVGWDAERDRARGALLSLTEGKAIPENEIITLQKVLGPDVAKELRRHGGAFPKGWNLLYEGAVMPKAILSSADLSYPLRQGVMLAPGHPVEFGKAWVPMFRAFASEDMAQAVNRALIENKQVITLADGRTVTIGRALQDTGALRTLDPSLTTSEEAFRGSLAERIPGIGHMVRASNRAFTTFGNKFRGDVFATLVKGWERKGVPITEDRLQNLSNMLNRFSGRGTLGDSKLTNLLQATWWSPQTRIAPGQAFGQLFNADRAVRAEAWRNMAAFLGTGMTLMGAAHLSGAKVGIDPRDTDFGKIVVGKTHINVFGPSQVMARTMARVISGQRLDINRGIVPADRVTEAVRYFRSGLAPEWAIIWDIAAKENIRGQAMDTNLATLKRELPERILPLAIQDMNDAIREEGAVGAALSAGTVFGESASVYGPTVKQQADEIGQFKGLSIEEHEQIRDFYDKVDLWRNEQEEEFGEADSSYERSIERVAEKEKFDPTLVEWAKVLKSQKLTERNRNPEYDKYILDHWDEVKRDAPYLITDRLRKLHASQGEPRR